MSDWTTRIFRQPATLKIYSTPEGKVVISDATGQFELFLLTPDQADVFAGALMSKADEIRKSCDFNQ